jgi:LysR family transcriptional regulator, cyn operon transcriptional activator
MDLRQLRYLVATADHGTMTAAARALHVAQPALSRAIRSLERELGVEVFARDGRGVVLTERGADVVAAARRVLLAVDEVAALGGRSGRPRPSELRLAWTPTIGATLSSSCLPGFHARHPEVSVVVLPTNSPDQVLAAVHGGQADVGFRSNRPRRCWCARPAPRSTTPSRCARSTGSS